VLEEIRVFCRDKGLDELFRDFVHRHNRATFQVIFSHKGSVIGENLGDDGWLVVGQAVDLRKGSQEVQVVST
jgi:hypothetical protein